jgi:hypothetical protein
LSEMPASHARNGWRDTRVGASARSDIARALQVNLTYPGESLGSRRARMGPRATRTSLIPLAFSMLNTGDFGRDVKASGK